MRLDKFLSQQLGISRSLVARELRAGKVTVDDEIVKSGAVQVSPEQVVAYEGSVLVHVTGPRYFMLHKPQGYVCSTDDPAHPTILYFIDEPLADNCTQQGALILIPQG
ncbi:Ribosomal small subunit pseudouridine synthase A [Providencia stuartii]|nr:Ribosomal small subunit pseudouridine synthase A [Providencia stuartii]